MQYIAGSKVKYKNKFNTIYLPKIVERLGDTLSSYTLEEEFTDKSKAVKRAEEYIDGLQQFEEDNYRESLNDC